MCRTLEVARASSASDVASAIAIYMYYSKRRRSDVMFCVEMSINIINPRRAGPNSSKEMRAGR